MVPILELSVFSEALMLTPFETYGLNCLGYIAIKSSVSKSRFFPFPINALQGVNMCFTQAVNVCLL